MLNYYFYVHCKLFIILIDSNGANKKNAQAKEGLKEKTGITIFTTYTGAPVVGTPILRTHYIVSCDAEVCGAERESSRTIRGRVH